MSLQEIRHIAVLATFCLKCRTHSLILSFLNKNKAKGVFKQNNEEKKIYKILKIKKQKTPNKNIAFLKQISTNYTWFSHPAEEMKKQKPYDNC